jgi:hypothetical protein
MWYNKQLGDGLMKKIILLLIIILFMACNGIAFAAGNMPEFQPKAITVSGSIFDSQGNLFKESVTILIRAKVLQAISYDSTGQEVAEEDISEYKINTNSGTFNYSVPSAHEVEVFAQKEGYHDDGISLSNVTFPIESKEFSGIQFYMIPKGKPVDLEYTHDAFIDLEGGKEMGWSFKRRWCFPADNYDVQILLERVNDYKVRVSMKEGGGFIKFDGYKRYKDRDKMVAAFDWMTKAPEMGYEQSFEIWDQQSGYYYFRTPDGKYGKLVVHSWRPKDLNFSYYLNPTGSRSLELKDKIEESPQNPKSKAWRDEWKRKNR